MALSRRGVEFKVNDRGHVKLLCPDCKFFDAADWCEKSKVHVPAGFFCLVSPAVAANRQK
ncbi:MAG TPA: hypothetical protein VKK79_22000 [Candidatus Lokiarchaeia archaeon]|nr:hypothetical protein [Candidatus Lokiarchaeia archaeon]